MLINRAIKVIKKRKNLSYDAISRAMPCKKDGTRKTAKDVGATLAMNDNMSTKTIIPILSILGYELVVQEKRPGVRREDQIVITTTDDDSEDTYISTTEVKSKVTPEVQQTESNLDKSSLEAMISKIIEEKMAGVSKGSESAKVVDVPIKETTSNSNPNSPVYIDENGRRKIRLATNNVETNLDDKSIYEIEAEESNKPKGKRIRLFNINVFSDEELDNEIARVELQTNPSSDNYDMYAIDYMKILQAEKEKREKKKKLMSILDDEED